MLHATNNNSGSHAMNKTKHEHLRTAIEVCQGHDCFGRGGGAVLIDIEELMKEHQFQMNHTRTYNDKKMKEEVAPSSRGTNGEIRVVKGGCRNFCSMGPNVHVHEDTKSLPTRTDRIDMQDSTKPMSMPKHYDSDDSDGSCSSFIRTSQHFAEVSSSEKIDKVVEAAGISSINSSFSNYNVTSKPPPPVLLRMLRTKKERLRWLACREVARVIANNRQQKGKHFRKLENQAGTPKQEGTTTNTLDTENPKIESVDNCLSSYTSSRTTARQSIEDSYHAEVAFHLANNACDKSLDRASRRKERLLQYLFL